MKPQPSQLSADDTTLSPVDPAPWSGVMSPAERRALSEAGTIHLPALVLLREYDHAHMAAQYATDEAVQAYWTGYRSALRSAAACLQRPRND